MNRRINKLKWRYRNEQNNWHSYILIISLFIWPLVIVWIILMILSKIDCDNLNDKIFEEEKIEWEKKGVQEWTK
jgi:hypothetical protein